MNGREDIFIIWGNGLKHLFEIINDIRSEGNYEIINITKHTIDNMEKFIHDVYECDTVPFEHLIAKTRYLLDAPQLCYVVYVNNNNVKEKYYGEGAFKHIQCATIKATKENIRNKFNPRAGNRRSEEHVIHGTDYIDQTIYLKKFFEIPEKIVHEYKDLPSKVVPIDSIFCNILGRGIIPIKQSPHFKFVNGNEDGYINYITKYMGVHLIEDHLPQAFKLLIDNFDLNKADGIIVRLEKGKYILNDGVHRTSILAHNGKTDIKIYIQT